MIDSSASLDPDSAMLYVVSLLFPLMVLNDFVVMTVSFEREGWRGSMGSWGLECTRGSISSSSGPSGSMETIASLGGGGEGDTRAAWVTMMRAFTRTISNEVFSSLAEETCQEGPPMSRFVWTWDPSLLDTRSPWGKGCGNGKTGLSHIQVAFDPLGALSIRQSDSSRGNHCAARLARWPLSYGMA